MAENNSSSEVGKSTDKMQRSAYAAVIFLNVAEMYPEDAHVGCHYAITQDITPTSRDWVGLYKVGWMSPNDYHYYEWAPMPKNYRPDTEAQAEILFQAHNLPKDDGEFYQFCYVTSVGQIRGASTPFQFKRPSANDFVEIEDADGDMLIVKEKTSFLEENLNKVIEEKTNLVEENKNLCGERKELKKSLKEINKQLKEEKNAVKELNQKLDEKMKELDMNNKNTNDLILAHDELQDKIALLTKEKKERDARIEELEAQVASVTEKMKTLQNVKDTLEGDNQMLKNETEIIKTHLTQSEGKVANLASEIQKMQKEIERSEHRISEYQMEIAKLKADLHDQTVKSEQQINVMSSTAESVDKLKEKLRNTEDKLEAAVKIKEMLSNEMGAYSVANDELKKELEISTDENLKLKKEVERMETDFSKETELLLKENEGAHRDLENVVKEKEELQRELLTAQSEKVNRSESETGAMYALQMANEALKDRHKLMEADLEKKQAELKSAQKETSAIQKDLHREIEDLKERIVMCSDAYKQLYSQNRKLQKKCKSKLVGDSAVKNRLQTSGTCTTSTDPAPVSPQASNDSESVSSNETAQPIKLMKYIELYQEEKLKNETLQTLHTEQIEKKDEEIDKLKSTITSRTTELEHKLRSCMNYLSFKDQQIEELNKKLRELKTENDSATGQVNSPNPQMYGYPYNYHPVKNLQPLVYPYPPPRQSSSPDHLSDTDSTDGLPAPITPTLLPSAKAAAVRSAFYQSPDEVMELMFVDANSDWDKAVPSAPIDLEEDKFVDASGVAMRTCPGCSMSFSPDMSDADYEKHVLTHCGKICPVCDQIADDTTSDNDFEYHVNCCIDKKNSNNNN